MLHESLTSDHCSLTTALLPARLDDTGDLSLVGQAAEAQTADAKLTEERTRTPAELAAVMFAAAELRLARVFHSFCCGCHISPNPRLRALAERHPELAQQSASRVVVLGRSHDGDVHALQLFNLGVIDLREDELIAQ